MRLVKYVPLSTRLVPQWSQAKVPALHIIGTGLNPERIEGSHQ